MQNLLTHKLAAAMEADGIHTSFTNCPNLEGPWVFYVRVYEPGVSWFGMPTRQLEKLIETVPVEKVPTLIGTNWRFEEANHTQFFLKLRLKYGI